MKSPLKEMIEIGLTTKSNTGINLNKNLNLKNINNNNLMYAVAESPFIRNDKIENSISINLNSKKMINFEKEITDINFKKNSKKDEKPNDFLNETTNFLAKKCKNCYFYFLFSFSQFWKWTKITEATY